jgi:anti-sigma factor RsiW
MPHLSEKIAEYVLGELSENETADAARHLENCPACRNEVEAFRSTHAFLRTSPDLEPPRRIIFEAEKRPFAWMRWIPVGAAAAVMLAVVLAAPVHVQWGDSRLTVTLGEAAPPASIPASASQQPAPQAVNYEEIAATLGETQQEWLAGELRARDSAHSQEIQRLRADLAYLENMQRVMYRDTIENASSIQLLASRSED